VIAEASRGGGHRRPGGRLGARPAAGSPPQGFRRLDRRAPGAHHGAVPQSGQVGAHFAWCWVRDAGAQVEVATFAATTNTPTARRPASGHFESDTRGTCCAAVFHHQRCSLDGAGDGGSARLRGRRADLGAARVCAPSATPMPVFWKIICGVTARRPFAALVCEFDDRIRHVRSPMARHHALILKVAAERVREELTRIFDRGRPPARRSNCWMRAGMLADLLPEVAAMEGRRASRSEFHPEGDVWTHTLLLLEGLGRATPALAWGALLHDVGKPPTFRVRSASVSMATWRRASSWRTAS